MDWSQVNGVYATDPAKHPNPEILDKLTYDRALADHLHFMDTTALTMCRDRSIPIRIFSLFRPGNISRAIRGESVGTVVYQRERQTGAQLEPSSNGRTPVYPEEHFCSTK